MPSLKITNLQTDHIGHLSLEVHAGECVCLSGPSGVGKSLFLRAIADLDPHEGHAWLDNEMCESIAAADWRRRVGFLAAQSGWWSEQVEDHFINNEEKHFSQLGFSAEVKGWSVERLSSGEKQRLSLLRLLANKPEILLLDEPTANLDPESVKNVEALVKTYQQRHKAAVLWVTHDAKQVDRLADKHWTMTDAHSIQEQPVCN